MGSVVLGETDCAKFLLAKAGANPEEQTEARALAREGRMPWESLVEMAEAARGLNWAECVERCGDRTRDAVLYLAARHAGYGMSEVHGMIPRLTRVRRPSGWISRRAMRNPSRSRLLERS